MKHRLVALALLAGCNAHPADTTPDAPNPPDAAPVFAEAMPGAMPQLVNLGGATLATPKIQPIFFTADADVQAQIEQFLLMLGASAYWTATTSEYGVGALTAVPTIVTTDAVPTTDTLLTKWLATRFDGTHPGWTYDASTVYAVFLPAGAVITGSDGSVSCQDYGAYHDEVTGTAGQSIVYALIPRCIGMGPAIDDLTAATSHELIEAATDPRVNTAPAFGDSDADHYIWAYTPGAEVGDYCEYVDTAYQRLVGGFLVQRTWSNAAAKAGKDPCVPALDTPYIAAAPVLTDVEPIDGQSGPVMTRGAKVPLNMSKTIEVQLFSDVQTDDFDVSAIDVASAFGGTPAELALTWDKTTGHNGDTLHLTITRKVAGQFMGSEFAVIATVGRTPVSMWWGFAAN